MRSARIAILAGGLLLSMGSSYAQQTTADSWRAVEEILGNGSMRGDVFKVWMPRNDFKVTIKAQQVPSEFSLQSWVAFRRTNKVSFMRAELILTQDEVASAVDSFRNSGIQLSGLHQRLLYESPHVLSLRVYGEGDPVSLANALKTALQKTKIADKPSGDALDSTTAVRELGPRKEDIEQAMGMQGDINGSVLRFSVPRPERVTENGIDIPPAMGAASIVNFLASDEERTAVTGELVLTAGEINRVTDLLRSSGIEIASLYNCFVSDKPQLFCMRFWANGDGEALARGLRLAFDEMKSGMRVRKK